jgi:hypothetical protein
MIIQNNRINKIINFNQLFLNLIQLISHQLIIIVINIILKIIIKWGLEKEYHVLIIYKILKKE